jgi:hypothetical protein
MKERNDLNFTGSWLRLHRQVKHNHYVPYSIRNIVVGTVAIRGRFRLGRRDFSVFQNVQTLSGSSWRSYCMGTVVLSPGET